MLSKDQMFKEEFYLNLQNTIEKFGKVLLKDGYFLEKEGLLYSKYGYISDDYSYKSIIRLEIKDYFPNNNELNKNWPYLNMIQTEADLQNNEIYVSDNYHWDGEKSQDEIDQECTEIDKNAEIEEQSHLNKPTIYIKTGFSGKDSIGSKKIDSDILYLSQYDENGFRYDQPYKSHVITSILHSNVSIHELILELNTADLINLYENMYNTLKGEE